MAAHAAWGNCIAKHASFSHQEQHGSLPLFDLHDRDIRLLSDVAWVAFDYTIQLPDGVIEGRVTGMCRNTGGQWRIVSLHSSAVQAEKSPEH